MENNQQNNQNQPTFYQKYGWLIWILTGLLVMSLFFRNLNFKNPFFNEEGKKEQAIVTAINNSTTKIVEAVKESGNKIDKVGEKVEKNTESNKAGFQQMSDSISSLKKSCLTCQERLNKKPNKPKVIKKPCPPVKVEPKPCPCPEKPEPKKQTVVTTTKVECEYVLWNPTHTLKKVFATAEERKAFADEHGLVIQVEN